MNWQQAGFLVYLLFQVTASNDQLSFPQIQCQVLISCRPESFYWLAFVVEETPVFFFYLQSLSHITAYDIICMVFLQRETVPFLFMCIRSTSKYENSEFWPRRVKVVSVKVPMCTRKKFTDLIQFNIFVFHILNGFLIFLNVHKNDQ